MNIVLLWKCPK